MSDTVPSLAESLAACRSMIRFGSKSFSLAAKIFNAEERDAAFLLYGWCRYCDDAIDEVSIDRKEQEARLQLLRAKTAAAYRGEPMTEPVFVAFQALVKAYAIPQYYPFALLEGMEMDISRRQYHSLKDLIQYCYRVAGTVGLMMCHVMKISDARALQHACDLGIAMQLTNIARDVRDDAEMGRVYLPIEWLTAEKLPNEGLLISGNEAALARVVSRLLGSAESYYQSGDQGLKYLSFRAGCAVAAARNIYSQIGNRVSGLGAKAWISRVWISPPKKLWLLAKGVIKMGFVSIGRLQKPWRPVAIESIWSAP